MGFTKREKSNIMKREEMGRKKKPGFESNFEAYESPYSKSPGSAAVYDWAKEHHERMQRLGVPTTSSPNAYQNGDTFKTIKDGIKIVYEDGALGERGFKGIDHYHIINPNATNNYDLYLDKYGNPIPKNSKQSHILKRRS